MSHTARFVYALAGVVSFALLVTTASAAGNGALSDARYTALRPGLWEIRTATRMQGMPYELPPVPYTTTQCMTQEQLDNQENLSAVSGSQGNCEIHDADVTMERTDWTMTCVKNGMEVDAKGTITPISKEAYTGNVHFTMQGGSIAAVKGVVNVQGMWQGECSGKQSGNHMQPTFREPVYTPN